MCLQRGHSQALLNSRICEFLWLEGHEVVHDDASV